MNDSTAATPAAPTHSAEEMEALIAKALQRHLEGSASTDLVAKTIMAAIQNEGLRSKDQMLALLMRLVKAGAT